LTIIIPILNTMKLASQMIVDESAAAGRRSCLPTVRGHLNSNWREPSDRVDAALFVETKHFLLARDSTFGVAAKLVKAGADTRRLSGMLSSPMNRSEELLG